MRNVTSVSSSESMEDLSAVLVLLDEISEGLGTSGMSLDEMILEMRHIRETSDYEEETGTGSAGLLLSESMPAALLRIAATTEQECLRGFIRSRGATFTQ